MNDQSKRFWITVRRNSGAAKFYSSADTIEEARAVADFRNAAETDLRKQRAAEHARPIDQVDKYTYEVAER